LEVFISYQSQRGIHIFFLDALSRGTVSIKIRCRAGRFAEPGKPALVSLPPCSSRDSRGEEGGGNMTVGRTGNEGRFPWFFLDIPCPFVYCVRGLGGQSPPHTGPNPSPISDATEGTLVLFRNFLPPEDGGKSSIRPDMTRQVPGTPVIPGGIIPSHNHRGGLW